MMSARSESARAPLTAYEARQVREIAAWKSRPPNAFAEIFKRITLAGANLIEKAIPDEIVRIAIEKAYSAAEMLASVEDVKREAGVRDLAELRNRPLEECDRVALRVGAVANILATIEGAATGAGGVLTTILDIPLLFVLSLRTIIKIGHSYGYALDQEADRSFVLAVMITALSGSLETKQERLDELREIEELLIEETQEEIAAEEALSLLLQLEIFEDIPGIGGISGVLLNLAFMRRVDNTARRVLQERWLRDNGKVDEIEPLVAHELYLAGGWSGAWARVAYSSFYGLGFAAALPVYTAGALLRSIEGAITAGVNVAGRMRQTASTASVGNSRVRRRVCRGPCLARCRRDLLQQAVLSSNPLIATIRRVPSGPKLGKRRARPRWGCVTSRNQQPAHRARNHVGSGDSPRTPSGRCRECRRRVRWESQGWRSSS